MTIQTTIKQHDRYEGAMLGVAVGDALGAPLEFMTAEEIRRKYGGPVTEMIGGGWLSVEPGEVTDDTQMTLAVAEGIAETNGNTPMLQIGENFLTWYKTHPKDVGSTCAAVLEEMSKKQREYSDEWFETAHRLYVRTNGWTGGNGALMRTVYPALWYKNTSKAAGRAIQIGQMTHWNPASDEMIRIYTQTICRIVNSEKSDEDARQELDKLTVKPSQPTGFCVDSLMCALESIIRTSSFEEALIDAVNRGGDADTIGAITGGLAGAIYGASAIPLRWLNALDNEPNKRTVQMFHRGEMPSGNALLIRLTDLAHRAYEQK